MRTRTLSILISDLQGYTARQARSSRATIAADVERHAALLQPVFVAFGGDVVKSMGDAFLVAFDSATDAVLAAMQVQKQLGAHNRALADPANALHVRIGIATGEVERDAKGDVFGDPVNLAARLQTSAEPDAVWLAETTYLAMNKNEVQALEVGARVFKGIDGEVKVYRVLDECIAAARALTSEELARATKRPTPTRRLRLVLALAAAIVLAAIAVVVATRDTRPPAERFAADPHDLASADAWIAELTDQLFDAEERGTMQTIYREGRIEAQITALVQQLGERPALQRLRAVFLMANEPLAPDAPTLVLETATSQPELGDDRRFMALLDATCEYAAKDPAAAAVYARARAALVGR